MREFNVDRVDRDLRLYASRSIDESSSESKQAAGRRYLGDGEWLCLFVDFFFDAEEERSIISFLRSASSTAGVNDEINFFELRLRLSGRRD